MNYERNTGATRETAGAATAGDPTAVWLAHAEKGDDRRLVGAEDAPAGSLGRVALMYAKILLYRDNGTLLVEHIVTNVEQNSNGRVLLGPPHSGGIVENGMQVWSIDLVSRAKPVEKA